MTRAYSKERSCLDGACKQTQAEPRPTQPDRELQANGSTGWMNLAQLTSAPSILCLYHMSKEL